MSWNEARVALLPSGRRFVVQEGLPSARSLDDRPVVVLHSVREEGNGGQSIKPELVRSWLEERSFVVREEYLSSVQLTRGDIEVDLFLQEEEISFVDLTFTLSRETPSRCEAWQTFVTELCETWDFSLADPERGVKVEAAELLPMLARNNSWKEFEKAFQWPTVALAAR